MRGPLWEATGPLHHACEAHPVGGRMSKGNVTPQEWADWLWAFRCLHRAVDPCLPEHMSRELLLNADLSVLPEGRPSAAAVAFVKNLLGRDVTGAAYVLHGAHRSGGRVLAPTLVKRGLPCGHISYRHPDEVQDFVRQCRDRADAAPLAVQTFECLLAVMDEIMHRNSTIGDGPVLPYGVESQFCPEEL